MSPGEQVRVKLVADAAVTAIVSTRIYPSFMPQQTRPPALVLTVVDSLPQLSLVSVDETALTNARVQVDCYHRDYSMAHQLAEAVADCLDDMSDTDFQAVKLISRDLYDTELLVHRVSVDFSIWCGR